MCLFVFLFLSTEAKNNAQYMGWHSSYVQQFRGLSADVTEEFLKNQTDWMSKNFLEYGYNFVCLDGWVWKATTYNTDGYVTKFNSSWTGGWTEMANYVHNKGMKFGMYYNPGWVLKSIADNTNNKIKGTNIPIKNITNNDKVFEQWYEIDPTLPGAEQYVKGMVDYFISCGIDLLKVDFLREYEWHYGHDGYVKLLQWIHEAADNKMLITLSMPIGANHLLSERINGDVVRVAGDYWNDGWQHTSAINAGNSYNNNWPLANNVFDGLIASSDITSKDGMIATPDYYTFNDPATVDEKKTAITIRIVSGSAVEFGDTYFDIGGDENANYLRNSELTSLNIEGFMGKPLSMDAGNVRSQTWQGTDIDGNRIVAMFNRNNSTETRSVSFANDLGLSNSYIIRDLWKHENSSIPVSQFTSSVPAHGVVIIKIYVTGNPLPYGNPKIPKSLIAANAPILNVNGRYSIINTNSIKNLNILGASVAEGASIVQRIYSNNNNNKWQFIPVEDGYFKIINKNSNKSITIKDESTNAKAEVIQSGFNNLESDKWQIAYYSPGIYYFVNKKSGKVLDVLDKSNFNDALIVQDLVNNETSQRFRINLVETLATDLTSNFEDKVFKIYPNPCNSFLNINVLNEIISDNARLNFFNINGVEVKNILLKNEQNRIDVSTLPVGVYFLKIGELSKSFVVCR